MYWTLGRRTKGTRIKGRGGLPVLVYLGQNQSSRLLLGSSYPITLPTESRVPIARSDSDRDPRKGGTSPSYNRGV